MIGKCDECGKTGTVFLLDDQDGQEQHLCEQHFIDQLPWEEQFYSVAQEHNR